MTLPLDELVENPKLVNERAQDLDWAELLYEFEHALDDATALVVGLSDGQLQYKPEIKAFSMAEVLTHALQVPGYATSGQNHMGRMTIKWRAGDIVDAADAHHPPLGLQQMQGPMIGQHRQAPLRSGQLLDRQQQLLGHVPG